MRAVVVMRTPDGVERTVSHGDLIGRTPGAAVLIDDPRISEAHAIVSLRRGRLHLLSLRRLLGVGGRSVSDVALKAGMTIGLADELVLEIVRVELPEMVTGLRAPGLGTRILPQVASIVGTPPRLVGRFEPEARAHLWCTDNEWRLQFGRSRRTVVPGDHFDIDGVRFTLTTVAIDDAGPPTTIAGSAVERLRLVAFYDNVQIHRRNREVVTLGGTGARILSELIACGGPTNWEVLASAIWPGEPVDLALRHRWDVALGRVRTKLRETGVRDLLRADGSGSLALELHDGDEVDDRT